MMMVNSLYSRPNKPRTMAVPKYNEAPAKALPSIPKIVEVGRGTECHVTPAHVAQKMVQYLEPEQGGAFLEPEAGTGNLVAAMIDYGIPAKQITAVELSYELQQVLSGRFAQAVGLKIIGSCFLEHSASSPAVFDGVVMNPPFRTAKKHVDAALSMVRPGGVLIALVPVTFECAGMIELERLPVDTFAAAKVHTKIISIET